MFDPRLGDYVDVGFRLCEGNDEVELRKCFKKGDYEVLVIGYNEKGAAFGGTTTIEAFAEKFHGPVVLVGPDSADSFPSTNRLNRGCRISLSPMGNGRESGADRLLFLA